jgi:ferrous iron transport protein A
MGDDFNSNTTAWPEATGGPTLHPLSDLPTGRSGWVCQLRGGHEFTARVARLGFTPGTRVTVLQNYGRGPLIVSLRGARLALGRGEAFKIQVEVL